ncbi:hypothetical protein JM80_2675 [Cellulophaga sp. RHA_52]|uniref:Uncharacterized protein n=1 Tax=Cellulophaga lytica (strain ATCC 23178 / DSM 7489 / JCM 8516 / NBRC 14961 / NCIMB 1423 / VKM B-1433 / Cy l20) TaxID=867900 RepID=F0RAI6_CELLC|nr:hypothetical protein Celly_2732 [Cellulophaga lytica DSM 7489]TVZ10140.1 hypothetical protein JM80_2675 [Cellulophaga sp. RHA_52]WKB80881.1 hypothetical protein QYR09_14140 [Cellulophaga lytica]SNQ44479.1 conserved hypothetical protein [Cellulophaga lytica]
MEKIYSKQQNNSCAIMATSKSTVQFLLNYSKSMNVITYNEMQFENILN